MHAIALLLQDTPDPAMIHRLIGAMLIAVPIIIAIVIAIIVIPCWMILKKAGMTPWLSLLCLLPSLGLLVLLYILAFAEWKVVPAPQATWTPAPPLPPQPPRV